MENLYLCPNCMEKISAGDKVCPKCGGSTTTENEAHQLPVNSIVKGRYIVGKVLGAGGFGITYIGYDLKMNGKVAIKEFYMLNAVNRSQSLTVVPTNEKTGEAFGKGKERFLGEAKVLAQFMDEPGIVQVRDFFEENGTVYIVMEYIEGETLSQYAKREGPQSFEKIINMLEPVMLALGKVHKKGLIHRDISPSNIMLEKDGTVRLLDFGAARVQSLMGERSLSVMLKPGYAPEEQYRSHGEQGPWTDVYAMCATIYRLITGKVPPISTNRIFQDDIVPPSKLGAKISPQEEAALMRGLAVKSSERIRSMDELLKCLKGKKKPRRVVNRKKRARNAAAVLALGVCLLAGINLLSVDRGTADSTNAVSLAAESAPTGGEWVTENRALMVKKIVYEENGDISSVEEYKYDQYGNQTSMLTTSFFNGEILSSYENSYKYEADEETGDIELVSYGFTGSDGETDITYYRYEYVEQEGGEVRCSYDEEGNLLGWVVWEDGENGEKYTYFYYPNGSLEYYFIYNKDVSTQYDAEGNIISTQKYTYDENGNELSYEYKYGTYNHYIETYEYDENGQRISGDKILIDSSGNETRYSIEYEYADFEIRVWKTE